MKVLYCIVSILLILVLITQTQSYLIGPSAPVPRSQQIVSTRSSSGYSFTNIGDCEYLSISSPVDAPPSFSFGYLSNSSSGAGEYAFLLRPSLLLFLNESGSLLGLVSVQLDTWAWSSEVITPDKSYLFSGSDSTSSVSMTLLVSPMSEGDICSYTPSFFNLTIPPGTVQVVFSTLFCWYRRSDTITPCALSAQPYPGNAVYVSPNNDATEAVVFVDQDATYFSQQNLLNQTVFSNVSAWVGQPLPGLGQALYTIVYQPQGADFFSVHELEFPQASVILVPAGLRGPTCQGGNTFRPQNLSGGDIAGIVIGSIAGAVTLIGVIYFGYKRYHQRDTHGYDTLEG